MRALTVAEQHIVAGGQPAAPMVQTSPTTFQTSFNGITTIVTCSAPISFNFTLGASTTGKLIDFSTGLSVSAPPSCTVTTIDTKTHIESICQGTKCTTINLNNGQQVSETDIGEGDLGFGDLAAAEGVSFDTFDGDIYNESNGWYNFNGTDPFAGQLNYV